jgi:hypothetical protein
LTKNATHATCSTGFLLFEIRLTFQAHFAPVFSVKVHDKAVLANFAKEAGASCLLLSLLCLARMHW